MSNDGAPAPSPVSCRLHHGTVARASAQAGLPRIGCTGSSQIDPYLPFILQTLEKFPTLTASRLYLIVRERGYGVGADHFRHIISWHRPRPKAEAYLRLRTLQGEQAQADWGHFGRVPIDRAVRTLMAFVMVILSLPALLLVFDGFHARGIVQGRAPEPDSFLARSISQ
jgi:hypothetical protein